MEANIHYRMGRVHLHYELAEDALASFQRGLPIAQASGSTLAVSILHANEAWAFAMGGDFFVYFAHAGKYGQSGCWGLSESVYVTNTQKWQAINTLTGGAVTIPPVPTGLTATAGNTQIALSWNSSSGATSYNVLRSTVSGSGFASVATGLGTTSYTNTGLTNGTTYYYVVTATNIAGTSGYSNQASATPQNVPPPVPTGVPAGLLRMAGHEPGDEPERAAGSYLHARVQAAGAAQGRELHSQ